MRFLTPSSIAILAAVGLSRAAPVEVVHLAATPRLGYALQGSNHDALPVAAAAVAHEPRAADRPTSPHVGRGLSPTATGAGDNKQQQRRAPLPTSAPVILSPNATPNEIYDFYGPVPDTDEQLGPKPYKVQGAFFDWYQPEEVKAPTTPTLVARQDNPPVPTSQLPYPTFPSQYTSCQKCEPEYPKISSCAMASSAFQNGTTIFSDPTKYYSIIKCACADTFQAAYPQCLDCFQVSQRRQRTSERRLADTHPPSPLSHSTRINAGTSVQILKVLKHRRSSPTCAVSAHWAVPCWVVWHRRIRAAIITPTRPALRGPSLMSTSMDLATLTRAPDPSSKAARPGTRAAGPLFRLLLLVSSPLLPWQPWHDGNFEHEQYPFLYSFLSPFSRMFTRLLPACTCDICILQQHLN